MDISGTTLAQEYMDAVRKYPFLTAVERAYGLPYMLLFAVGSRETNLTNEVGDNGHGHGMFQLDDRSHTIPAGFDLNVLLQARTAAQMLQNLIKEWHNNLPAAIASYNCGSGNVQAALDSGHNVDYYTAHADYSADVLARRSYLAVRFPPVIPSRKVRKMFAVFEVERETVPAGKWWPGVGTFDGTTWRHVIGDKVQENVASCLKAAGQSACYPISYAQYQEWTS